MKKNYKELNKDFEVVVEEQSETLHMLTDILKEEVREILNYGFANKVIMGFCTMAMIQAGLPKEDARKVWDALEDVLEEYEFEDAASIYDLLMGAMN